MDSEPKHYQRAIPAPSSQGLISFSRGQFTELSTHARKQPAPHHHDCRTSMGAAQHGLSLPARVCLLWPPAAGERGDGQRAADGEDREAIPGGGAGRVLAGHGDGGGWGAAHSQTHPDPLCHLQTGSHPLRLSQSPRSVCWLAGCRPCECRTSDRHSSGAEVTGNSCAACQFCLM